MNVDLSFLTTREWAIASWILISLVWIASKQSLRRSFGGVLRALFQPIFVKAFSIAATYITACIYLLHAYEWWEVENLKTTILWILTFAFVAMFRLKSLNDPGFYRKTLSETFGFSALVVFITEFYTFPFWVELILLPILFFFTMMLELSKGERKYQSVSTLSGCILTIIASSYIIYSGYRTFTDPTLLITLDNGRDLFVPAALTVLFFPFLYFFGVWGAYNEIFAVLQVWLPDRRLRRFAKRRALMRFGTDVKTLNRWRQFVVTSRPTTREAVMQTIVEAWALKSRDYLQADVAASEGWEPIRASQFLREYQLEAPDYKPIGDGLWSASAPFLEIAPGDGSVIFRNNLGYYVSGSQFAATELSLVLNVNVPNESSKAEENFILVASALVQKALDCDTPDFVFSKVDALTQFEGTVGSTRLKLERDVWSGGIDGGYDWELKLTRGESFNE